MGSLQEEGEAGGKRSISRLRGRLGRTFRAQASLRDWGEPAEAQGEGSGGQLVPACLPACLLFPAMSPLLPGVNQLQVGNV